MAAVTSAAVAIPSFTGLKSAKPTSAPTTAKLSLPAPKFGGVRASMKDLGMAAVAATATAMLAGNAMAIDILLGSDDGSLAFVPSKFSVAAGETITFKNNAGFPHNIVFDQDEIPSGVDASKISMSEEDLLNAPGETYKVALTEKGEYTFYCSPHQGAGMVGKVTVN